MAEHITIRPADGLWVVRDGDSVLAESTTALELREGDYQPVIYFPRADVAMALLEPSAKTTTCPHKGEASHFSLQSKSALVEDVAWSYEAPKDEVAAIAGHLAFYPDKLAVEQL